MCTRFFSTLGIIAVVCVSSSSAAIGQTLDSSMGRLVRFDALGNGGLQAPEVPELKSEGTALSLSLLGTLVPLVAGTAILATSDDIYYSDANGSLGSLLIYTGLYFGPSMGYFYAGKSGRGWASFGLRNAIGLGMVIGVTAACPPADPCDEGAASAIVLIGGVGILASAIYDIANVKKTVRERNARQMASSLAVIPTYSRVDGPGVRVSLAVR